ncbi:MAG TPA: low-specificity L-threonine aldolase [Anaerolineales bacterium]
MEFIDLRSDTVTKPTAEMLEAMVKAPLGDDVYGEDPTVNRLQDLAAEITGKEGGLFVPTGTMGNLAALLAHCQRGDEVILGNKNHSFLYEAGGLSALGGIHSLQLQNEADGSLRLEDVEASIRPDDAHDPITRLVCLENTHNRCGGTVQAPEYTQRLGQLAHARGLKVHLDGARIFNAAAALGVPLRRLADPVDSITFCLSKGLCAPVGSVLCGSREFLKRAHRARKMLGGGMRQAGVLAAAGIVALEKMTGRLSEDHARARRLASGLKNIAAIQLDAEVPATNMVFLRLAEEAHDADAEIERQLKVRGILVHATGPRRFRLVTHYWVDDEAIDRTIEAFGDVLK